MNCKDTEVSFSESQYNSDKLYILFAQGCKARLQPKYFVVISYEGGNN